MPSFTSVNDSVAEVSVTPATARSTTAPGLVITGAVMVTLAAPVIPSLVAVIVAEPAAIAVSSPPALTVATAGALLVQVTERPVSTFPLASLSVAANCCVPPIVWLTLAGVTTTDATGAGTLPPPPLATRSVAIVRLSTHIVWSAGDPSPIHGAMAS